MHHERNILLPVATLRPIFSSHATHGCLIKQNAHDISCRLLISDCVANLFAVVLMIGKTVGGGRTHDKSPAFQNWIPAEELAASKPEPAFGDTA